MKRFTAVSALTALVALWTVAVFGLVASEVEAAVPRLINFQGVVKDSAGNTPLVDQLGITFTIYDAPLGGTALWTESHSVTMVSGGLFNVLLGEFNPIPDSVFEDTVRYVGIQVESDPEMLPRQRLTSAGYAFRTGQWTSAGQDIFRLSGNVGIGTNIPNPSYEPSWSPVVTVGPSGPNQASILELQSSTDVNSGVGALVFRNVFIGAAENRIAQIQVNRDGADDAGNVMFFTRPASGGLSERMRITSSGNAGIATASPNSKLHVNGSIAVAVRTVAVNTTLNETDNVVICANPAPMVVNLPPAGTCPGRQYAIKSASGSSVIIEPAGAETIDAAPNRTLSAGLAVFIISDGANWYILSNHH